LNRDHQRPSQEGGLEKFGFKLQARHRICGTAGWVIVASTGDNASAATSTAIASMELA